MKNFLIAVGLLTCLGCDKDENVQPAKGEFSYMIFGHFYGYCAGEGCIEIFKFDEDHLFEDTLDNYPSQETAYQGQYEILSHEQFNLVKDLVDDIPEGLYEEAEHVIGQPDAGDWGGVYVEIHYADTPEKSGFWLLDNAEFNMPDEYNTFVDSVHQKIALIR